MADWHDCERLSGFCNRLTNILTFVTENNKKGESLGSIYTCKCSLLSVKCQMSNNLVLCPIMTERSDSIFDLSSLILHLIIILQFQVLD